MIQRKAVIYLSRRAIVYALRHKQLLKYKILVLLKAHCVPTYVQGKCVLQS